MLRLTKINDNNWLDAVRLTVSEDQKKFLDDATGIIARGYIYRNERARVIGISDDDVLIGLALVKDMDEEPACYDLQQFMIDKSRQGKGYGTAALNLILSMLGKEHKYDCVEVCVKKDDFAAIHVYEKVGFTDTGYIDDDAPDSLNLMYYFPEDRYTDRYISDFTDPVFTEAFRKYFSELGINVEDWDGLFREMNEEDCNMAIVRTDANGEATGFIQYKTITFTSSFFEETCGFIREFWISEGCRGSGHGSSLLRLAEKEFLKLGIRTSILTTDTAEEFYIKNGYGKCPGVRARNEDDVFVKRL